MDKLLPGARRALRQAHLYGYLVEREGRFYYPGSMNIVCSRTVLATLLHLGLVESRGRRCEITPEGRRVAMELNGEATVNKA
jgi:ribosomal protein S19E (S16A)